MLRRHQKVIWSGLWGMLGVLWVRLWFCDGVAVFCDIRGGSSSGVFVGRCLVCWLFWFFGEISRFGAGGLISRRVVQSGPEWCLSVLQTLVGWVVPDCPGVVWGLVDVLIDSVLLFVLLVLLRLLGVVPHKGEVLLGGHGESADVQCDFVSGVGF